MKHKLLIIGLILFFFQPVINAQASKTDSLQSLLTNHTNVDTSRVNLLLQLANTMKYTDLNRMFSLGTEAYHISDSLNYIKGKTNSLITIGTYFIFNQNYTTAIDTLHSLLKFSNTNKLNLGIAFANKGIGLAYFYQYELDSAMLYYQKALVQYKEMNDDANIGTLLNNLGNIYYMQGDYPRTLEYYQNAIKHYEQINDQFKIASTTNNIALILKNQYDDLDQSLEYLQKAYSIIKESPDKRTKAELLRNIGAIYDWKEDYDRALDYYNHALVLSEETHDLKGQAGALINIGIVYRKQNKLEKAKGSYVTALALLAKTDEKNFLSSVYQGLGNVNFLQGKYSEALQYAQKSKTLAIEHDMLEEQEGAYHLLYEIYSKTGQYKQALENHELYKTYYDSIFNKKDIQKFANLENEYKFNKEKEIIAANQAKKDAVLDAEMKRQKQLRNIFIGGFLIFLALAIIIFRNLIQKRKANRLLAKQKDEIHAQSEEMRAINEKLVELDLFKQSMTGMIVHDLKNPLNSIINPPATFSLVKQLDTAKQMGKQMLNLVLNILDVNKYEETKMTIEKSNLSLYEISHAALNEVMFLAERKNINISNKINYEVGVSGDREILERIFVNLLTNAIKHSQINGNIEIESSIQTPPGVVKISVTDDGEGIAQDKIHLVFEKFSQVSAKKSGNVRSTGLGLTFCKLAVEAHGGIISGKSDIGKGTTFEFTIPISEKKEVSDNSQHKFIEKDSTLEISESAKKILKPYAKKLEKILVYESSKIKNVLSEIDTATDKSLAIWKEEVEKSMFEMNEKKYIELIKLIS